MINDNIFFETNKCRFSGSPLEDAEIIVEFDSLPIPGLFFSSNKQAMDKKVPMTLVRSKEGFIQLKETINVDLYYYYKSRQADKNHKDWIEDIAKQMKFRFKSQDNILEIGGGEGMLLDFLHKKGFINLYNVDPSHENESNLIFKAINGIFPDALDINYYRNYFSCIIGQHFLEHVPDPLNVLQGARDLLSDDGELWIEVPDMESSALLSYLQTGIIYPLHLSYFTKASLKALGEKAGLYLEFIEDIEHYGNSIWAKFSKKPNNNFLNINESLVLIPTIKRYFEDLKIFAHSLPKEILCWGAAERAHTIYGVMSSFGIKAISIFDSNPEIKGMYICGINTPILGPESFPDYPNDLLILSPPNHKSIVEGIKNKLSKNTMIHIPLIGHYTFEKYEEKFFNK